MQIPFQPSLFDAPPVSLDDAFSTLTRIHLEVLLPTDRSIGVHVCSMRPPRSLVETCSDLRNSSCSQRDHGSGARHLASVP